jgi:hypothetical protein
MGTYVVRYIRLAGISLCISLRFPISEGCSEWSPVSVSYFLMLGRSDNEMPQNEERETTVVSSTNELWVKCKNEHITICKTGLFFIGRVEFRNGNGKLTTCSETMFHNAVVMYGDNRYGSQTVGPQDTWREASDTVADHLQCHGHVSLRATSNKQHALMHQLEHEGLPYVLWLNKCKPAQLSFMKVQCDVSLCRKL